MAEVPNRLIRESVCTSRTIAKLTWFEEAFYYRLWVNCDDYGRMDAEPRILRARLFPLVDDMTCQQVEGALHRLVEVGSVRLYEAEGAQYLEIVNWGKYQQIRAKRSKYPVPPDSRGTCVPP